MCLSLTQDSRKKSSESQEAREEEGQYEECREVFQLMLPCTLLTEMKSAPGS
jgi:hypothetical protein